PSFVAGSSEASRHTTGRATHDETAQASLGGGGRRWHPEASGSRSAPGPKRPAPGGEDWPGVVLSPRTVGRGGVSPVSADDGVERGCGNTRRGPTYGKPGASPGRGGTRSTPPPPAGCDLRGRRPPAGRSRVLDVRLSTRKRCGIALCISPACGA